jgi:hypothetical protein
VVSGVVFRVPDDQVGRCLWDALRATCTSRPSGARRRLVIADSKQLFRSRGGLTSLERAALVMLAVAGRRPATWRALLDVVAPQASELLTEYAWYADINMALPLSDGIGDVGTQANAIRHDCSEHGVSFRAVFSEPLPEGHFNRLVRNTRNKAVVLLGLVLRILDRIMRHSPDEHVRVLVDRLGGRVHYRDALITAMPACDLEIREESALRSVYHLTRSPRTCEIAFVTGGDSRHFPTALASVYSKYLRELYMRAFNDHWSRRVTGLYACFQRSLVTPGYRTSPHGRLLPRRATLAQRCVAGTRPFLRRQGHARSPTLRGKPARRVACRLGGRAQARLTSH